MWVLLGLCMYVLQLQRDLDSIPLKSRPAREVQRHWSSSALSTEDKLLWACCISSGIHGENACPSAKVSVQWIMIFITCQYGDQELEWMVHAAIYSIYDAYFQDIYYYISVGFHWYQQKNPPACKVKNDSYRMCFLHCALPSVEKETLQADKIIQTFGCWTTDGQDLHAHVAIFSQQLGA